MSRRRPGHAQQWSTAVPGDAVLPLVAIVGRPNVGKSTLVNRLVGRREAIVHDRPGVTRDRKELEAEWLGRRFRVVDTGGWQATDTPLDRQVARQAEQAIAEADVVVMVTDVTVGVTEEDAAVATLLRRSDRAVVLVANKADHHTRDADAWDFARLGLGDPIPVSAMHGRSADVLLDALLEHLGPEPEAPDAEDDAEPYDTVPTVADLDTGPATTRAGRGVRSFGDDDGDAETPDLRFLDMDDLDTGDLDTGGLDTGGPDTGGPDTGGPDTGGPDTGGPDTGGPDTGGPDTGGPDTGADRIDRDTVGAGSMPATRGDGDGASATSRPDGSGRPFAVAIVGRPNVGKSTLFNHLVGDERSIVHDLPGTTRDTIDTVIRTEDGVLRVVDTAGIRRRSRIDDGVEWFSLVRALRAVDAADATLLVIDATEGVTHQDQRLAERIDGAGCAVVIVLNKWDLVAADDRDEVAAAVSDRLGFLAYAPVLRVSALTGRGTLRILPALRQARREYRRRVPTARLNTVLQEAQRRHPPPIDHGHRPRILYATQGAADPPTFTLFANRSLPPTYLRYLERMIREAFSFGPTPIKLRVRRRDR